MDIRQATPSEFDIVTDLLEKTTFSPEDLTPGDMNDLLVCERTKSDWLERMAILRTVAILPDHRLPDRGHEICGIVGLTVDPVSEKPHLMGHTADSDQKEIQARPEN